MGCCMGRGRRSTGRIKADGLRRQLRRGRGRASAVLLLVDEGGLRGGSATIGNDAFQVILGTICGSFGALLFATARSNRLVLDANAGESLHRLEGLARIGAGLIGALLVALAIKAGLILGGATFSGSKLALLLCFCIVAGASERLVPNIVATLEKTVAGESRERNSSRTTKSRSV